METRIIQEAIFYSNAGFTVIKTKGKIPIAKNWTKQDYIFPDEIPNFLGENYEGNIGIALSRRQLVVDVDPRRFKQGDNPHVRFFQDADVKIKQIAAIARTGGGGLHIYLKLPEGVQVRNENPDYRGVEFKSAGRQVVGVGSVHPDTGKLYEWADGVALSEIQEAPPAFVALIRQTAKTENLVPKTKIEIGSKDADADVTGVYTKFLKETPPSIQGDLGDETAFKVACRGRDLGLSVDKVFELMVAHFNPRCIPSWEPARLSEKVRNAFSYATNPPGAALPEADFEAIASPDAGSHELYRGWDFGQNGKPLRTVTNVLNYFLIADSPFRDSIAWDEFNGQVRIQKKLPWHRSDLGPGGAEWSDADSIQLKVWLSRVKRMEVAVKLCDEAVLAAAYLKTLHPVKDYLRELKWDGVVRLDTWLSDFAGAVDNAFVREVSRKFLIQAVSRVYHPGCKADHVIVLEGDQGVGKSSLVEILGRPWYADIAIDPHARDTVDAMRGKWFVELSEMEALKRTDAQALKAFITRRTDRVRLAYGRRSVDLPRQSVFMGTINPDATLEYLTDPTGNRRIWPIHIAQVDFKRLEDARDQLFAEAVDALLKGESTHILTREAMGQAVKEQAARQISDPWHTSIAEWAEGRRFLTSRDIWIYALKAAEAAFSLIHQRRIAQVLKDLGYEPHVKRDIAQQKAVRGFINPEIPIRDEEDILK